MATAKEIKQTKQDVSRLFGDAESVYVGKRPLACDIRACDIKRGLWYRCVTPLGWPRLEATNNRITVPQAYALGLFFPHIRRQDTTWRRQCEQAMDRIRDHGETEVKKMKVKTPLQTSRPAQAQPSLPGGGSSRNGRRTGLLDLPTEILASICELLTSAGRVYHITQLSKPLKLVSVHLILPKDELWDEKDQIIEHKMALAATCRRLNNIACSAFYGKNHFVFELATVSLESTVTFHSTKTWKRIEREGWGPVACATTNWSRTYKADSAHPLWPLTPRNAKHVGALTLHVCSSKGTSAELKALRSIVSDVVEMFQGKHELKSVGLYVSTAATTDGAPFHGWVNTLEVGEDLDVSLGSVADDPGLEPEWRPRLQEVLTHFSQLRGVRQVRVGGIVQEGFASDLARDIQQEEVVESIHSVDAGEATQRRSKRRRV